MNIRMSSIWGIALSIALLSGIFNEASATDPANGGCSHYPYCFTKPRLVLSDEYMNANPPAPTFKKSARQAICAAEAVLSLLATYYSDIKACENVTYNLSIDTSRSPSTAILSALQGASTTDLQLKASMIDDSGSFRYGDKCQVTVVDSHNTIFGTPVSGYTGNMSWGAGNRIMDGTAYRFNMGSRGDRYDEVIIKDFFHDASSFIHQPDGQPFEVDYDWGLEAINKHPFDVKTLETDNTFGSPISKWYQKSMHLDPDGDPGELHMKKFRLLPNPRCVFHLDLASTPNDSLEIFAESGTVKVETK
jgi:hypothetical protein